MSTWRISWEVAASRPRSGDPSLRVSGDTQSRACARSPRAHLGRRPPLDACLAHTYTHCTGAAAAGRAWHRCHRSSSSLRPPNSGLPFWQSPSLPGPRSPPTPCQTARRALLPFVPHPEFRIPHWRASGPAANVSRISEIRLTCFGFAQKTIKKCKVDTEGGV